MTIFYITTTVHISKSLRESVGSTTHTYSIANELQKCGHTVHVFSEKDSDDASYENIHGIHVHRLKRAVVAPSSTIKKSRSRHFLKYLRFIPNTVLASQIASLAKKEGCDVLFERGHSRGVAGLVSTMTNIPMVLETVDHIYSPLSLKKAKTVFSYTNAYFPEKHHHKYSYYADTIDPSLFHPVTTEKKYDVVYCGSFKEWDGLFDIVSAAQEIIQRNSRAQFLMVGDGRLKEEMEHFVTKKGLAKHFTFTGKVPLQEVKTYLSQARIGVAPFNTQNLNAPHFKKYGFHFPPLKIFEYMACGLPVITIDAPQIKKRVTSDSGFFINEGDAHALAQNILHLLEDTVLQEQMADFNVKKANEHTWHDVALEIESALKSAVI
ncbi:glycosyltransferase [Patescibacteria group bacterium]|nr:glycosyltransferase [Patescibacteria group bacterium]